MSNHDWKTMAKCNKPKTRNRGTPLTIFPESLDPPPGPPPPRDFDKNFSHPLPCIFNPCESISYSALICNHKFESCMRYQIIYYFIWSSVLQIFFFCV